MLFHSILTVLNADSNVRSYDLSYAYWRIGVVVTQEAKYLQATIICPVTVLEKGTFSYCISNRCWL
jgi:hypothetical protein